MKGTKKAADLARNAQRAEDMLRQLAHAGRLRLLCSLVEGKKSAGELTEIAGLSQSAVSQHLKKLRDAGLVSAQRRGQMIIYSLDNPEARALLQALYRIYCG
ncbi:MAG TPA: metalloregulator ArsR/SmtB family transcription factor [Rhizomicrobium sp.]|nr:metalloregulator ArsR/SmtB family transcription factor [Rhizomicrobium sp.]